jgi:hypothetical protein
MVVEMKKISATTMVERKGSFLYCNGDRNGKDLYNNDCSRKRIFPIMVAEIK